MSTRTRNYSQKNRPLPALDLHGLYQGPAVRRVTDFIEEHSRGKNVVVRIITGTGSHSPHGPVLRTAVKRLLEKRKMTFEQDSPGSFIVHCDTGIALYAPDEPSDSKVVVIDENERPQRSVSLSIARPKRPVAAESNTDTNTTSVLRSQDDMTPSECMEEHVALYNAREASLRSYQEERCHNEEEKQAMHRALQVSMKQLEEERAEEEALIQKALLLSQEQQNFSTSEEEELLLRLALEDSQRTSNEKPSDEDMEDIMREVLENSLREAQRQQEAEERMIRQALALSLKQSVGGESIRTSKQRLN